MQLLRKPYRLPPPSAARVTGTVGRLSEPKAIQDPGWRQSVSQRRRVRRIAAQSSEEQQPAAPAAGAALAADAARQVEASRSGSSVSSTLDSLDALLSSGSIDAQEDEPGAEHGLSLPPLRLRSAEVMWTSVQQTCRA